MWENPVGVMENWIQTLESTPGTLAALLDGVDDALLRADYGAGTWSPFDILGHLIQGEIEDWIPRARIVIEHGESRAFDPFDHRAAGDATIGIDGPSRLATFRRLREENLRALGAMRIDAPALTLRGMHPALGTVTLSELIATWATHDLHHIAQICKALAFQNRGDVGPWRAYLGIIAKAPTT